MLSPIHSWHTPEELLYSDRFMQNNDAIQLKNQLENVPICHACVNMLPPCTTFSLSSIISSLRVTKQSTCSSKNLSILEVFHSRQP